MSLQKSALLESSPPTKDLRARILAEAARLFAEKGYAATSVREVVEGCDCTKPALYYYFRNKEALFLEVIREETKRITDLLEEMQPTEGTVREHMARGMDEFLDHVRRHPMRMRLLMRAELQPDEGQPEFDFTTTRATHMALIRSMLEHGVRHGEIRDDLCLDDAAKAVAGIVDRWLHDWLRGDPLPDDLTDRVLPIFFRGVAAKE